MALTSGSFCFLPGAGMKDIWLEWFCCGYVRMTQVSANMSPEASESPGAGIKGGGVLGANLGLKAHFFGGGC